MASSRKKWLTAADGGSKFQRMAKEPVSQSYRLRLPMTLVKAVRIFAQKELRSLNSAIIYLLWAGLKKVGK